MEHTFKTLALTALLAVAGTGCEDSRARKSHDIRRTLVLKDIDHADRYTEDLARIDTNYPAPQDLEFQLRDMNEDDKQEFTISYGTNDYLLRAEGTNVLRLIPFRKEIRVNEFD